MPTNKIPLTAIILYNKKQNNIYLEQAKTALDFCAELLLIDVGEEPIADFAQARNQAVVQATQKWVLFVDADEVLQNGAENEIRRIINEDRADLVGVLRSDIFMGMKLNWGEAGQISLLRMGRKNKLRFIRPVHEIVEVPDDAKVLQSQIKLNHFAHDSIASFLNKVAYYAKLDAASRKRESGFVIGMQLLFFPVLKFILNYFFKFGFLDGVRGLIYAIIMSMHSLMVRVFMLDNRHEKN